jgi:predicted ribosomally synthesized peptide with nif11-like leader
VLTALKESHNDVETIVFKSMTIEQLKAFASSVAQDADQLEKLKTADLNETLLIAREAGFDVTKADLESLQEAQPMELADDELEAISGGVTPTVVAAGYFIGGYVVTKLADEAWDYGKEKLF